MHYDPKISVPFTAEQPEGDLQQWDLYDRIRCPTMVLRGESSDLLTRDTANEMALRGPRAKVAEIAGVGHAPTLIHEDQIQLVREFLSGS
jgi:pimeloyl-ACP methyl ester carboxylesterase